LTAPGCTFILIRGRCSTPGGTHAMTGWDERVAQLEAEFPGWHIWRSSAGRWWATRTGFVLRRENLGTGRVMTLDADDEPDLRGQLTTQADLDRELEEN
jgi:hypothetical protein